MGTETQLEFGRSKDTQLEFGHRLPDASEGAGEPEAESLQPMRCPTCGQHFSAEGRFCPFDREPLVRDVEWDPKADALLGSTVDQRYEVEAVIGEGGMGRVYQVRHVSLGKRFALKALRRDLASDADVATRFIHEARTAASVTHPGLVQISDFGYLPTGQAYFVMELLDGLPLSALLRRYGALPADRAIQIGSKIAEALAVAHAAGVIHRDLKPDNVHIRPCEDRDDVKIVDFGLAKVIGSSRLTQDGVVFGTPYYMSPEQASGDPTDHRADIYALGVVLYEMLTSRVPFEADTYMGVLSKHIYLKPVPPSEHLGMPGALGELEDIVMRCLEKKPEARFATLEEVHAALEALPKEPYQGLAPRPLPSGFVATAREELDTSALERLPRSGLPAWAIGIGVLIVSSGLGALVVALIMRGSVVSEPRREPKLSPTVASVKPPMVARPVAPAPLLVPSAAASAVASVAPPRAKPASSRATGTKAARKPIPRLRDTLDPWAK